MIPFHTSNYPSRQVLVTMTMFYAKIDAEQKYGWDLTDSSGPPTPPGRRYKSAWNDLKAQAKKNRVAHHAEYMLQQEGNAKLKDAEALLPPMVGRRVYRACDFADHMICRRLPPRSPRFPVATPTKLKWEEIKKCKDKASGGWLINRDKQGIPTDADCDGDKRAHIERLLEGTAKVGAVAHQNIDNLAQQNGKLEGILEKMGKRVLRLEHEFNAQHDKLRQDHEELRAKQQNDINDVMTELQKLKLVCRANRRRH